MSVFQYYLPVKQIALLYFSIPSIPVIIPIPIIPFIILSFAFPLSILKFPSFHCLPNPLQSIIGVSILSFSVLSCLLFFPRYVPFYPDASILILSSSKADCIIVFQYSIYSSIYFDLHYSIFRLPSFYFELSIFPLSSKSTPVDYWRFYHILLHHVLPSFLPAICSLLSRCQYSIYSGIYSDPHYPINYSIFRLPSFHFELPILLDLPPFYKGSTWFGGCYDVKFVLAESCCFHL